jgi:acyl-coenzyme A synthetase/AMP-(fatty) acid ligase
MGDVGYLDKKGRIWFLGRKNHRVKTENKTYYTIPIETIFNKSEKVYRSALVGINEFGKMEPVIIIEPYKEFYPKTKEEKIKFKEELLKISSKYEVSKDIKNILFHSSFPVDIRHNAKIFREKLKIWADKEVKNIV